MSGNQHKDFNKFFNTVEEAIDDIREGKVIIVVDDENRENEGDFVAAAALQDMFESGKPHVRACKCKDQSVTFFLCCHCGKKAKKSLE